MTGAPVYIAVDAGDADKKEVAVRLPKDIATRLLIALSPNYADEVGRVI
jgi:hypothetical protein